MSKSLELTIPIDVKVLNSCIFRKNVEIGKITETYFKDNQLWMTITINSFKIKQLKQLLKAIKNLK
jgi:hypothetical protein